MIAFERSDSGDTTDALRRYDSSVIDGWRLCSHLTPTRRPEPSGVAIARGDAHGQDLLGLTGKS
jgi:hypothetical protein